MEKPKTSQKTFLILIDKRYITKRVMKMSIIKNCVAMILMIILVVTQVKCITTSQEFRPIVLKGAVCEIKCDLKCAGKRLADNFNKCVKDCEQHCTATMKTKTLP
jgi:hypothetical protein